MSVHAFAALGAKQSLVEYSYELSPLGPPELEIEISHCGICHSDLNLIDDDWGRSVFPLIPGHEIVGSVAETAAGSSFRTGQRVGVGWQRSACHACALCLQGHENLCATQQATCIGHPGGFAERIRVDERFVFALPDSLESAGAAPLLCAGATVFAPMRRWGVGRGSVAGVIGIGGLGHLALRFLRALGAHPVAFTSSADKQMEAERLGAEWVCSSVNPREILSQADRLDFLLCTVPARLDWISYLRALKPNGVLCLVGAPPGLLQLPAAQLLNGQRVICGSDIASPAVLREMLAFAGEHGIGAQVQLAPLREVNAALAQVRRNEARYRLVLEV